MSDRKSPELTNSTEEFASAALNVHGLALSLGDPRAIVQNVQALADAAADVSAFPLPDEIEVAPFFRA